MAEQWTNPTREHRARRIEALRSGQRPVPISFAIVGVQKAATSSVYRMLVRHPRIVGGLQKELQHFANERLTWPDADLSDYARPSRSPGEDLAGDASPVYLFWPHALERMRAHRPDMRLIAIFRDPIERAVSQWRMERRRHATAMPDLREAIATFDLGRLPEEIPAGVRPRRFRRTSLFTRGLYGRQLERGLDVFPREQWLLLEFRSVVREPARALDQCTAHLGIESFPSPPELPHVNQSTGTSAGEPPSADDIRRLVDSYAADLEVFERLSGLDISHWPTRRVVVGSLDSADLAESISRKLGLR